MSLDLKDYPYALAHREKKIKEEVAKELREELEKRKKDKKFFDDDIPF